MHRFPSLAGIAGVIILGTASAVAQPAPRPLVDTEAFRVAFGMSFYGFDWCGDDASGRAYRRALLEKLAHCPFSPGAKQEFTDWSEEQETRLDEVRRRYIAEHGGLPERLDGMKTTCREQIASPEYRQFRDLLARYRRGEVTAEALLPEPCDVKAGWP